MPHSLPRNPPLPAPSDEPVGGGNYAPWQHLLERLQTEHVGEGHLAIRSELPGGKSGAQTLVVDVLADAGATAEPLDGQYVLKLDRLAGWAGEVNDPEFARHERVFSEAPEFAEQHVPR